MKYLVTALLTFVTLAVSAEMSLLETVKDGAKECKAHIKVRATGTAGPFTILVITDWGTDSVSYDGVEGDIVVEGLCEKLYEVQVFPEEFPSCGKTFTVDMTPSINGGKSLREPLVKLEDGELLVEPTPNPASGSVTVTVYSGVSKEVGTPVNYEVTVLSESGKTMKQISVAKAGEKTTFPLDVQNLSPGVYLIRVVGNDKTEDGTGRLVVI